MLCLVARLYLTVCDYSPTSSCVHGDSPGKNTGVGGHSRFQAIFATQGVNPGLLHCGRILYQLSRQGSQTDLQAEDLERCEPQLSRPALEASPLCGLAHRHLLRFLCFTVSRTVGQHLCFRPRISRGRHKSSSDDAGTAEKC